MKKKKEKIGYIVWNMSAQQNEESSSWKATYRVTENACEVYALKGKYANYKIQFTSRTIKE